MNQAIGLGYTTAHQVAVRQRIPKQQRIVVVYAKKQQKQESKSSGGLFSFLSGSSKSSSKPASKTPAKKAPAKKAPVKKPVPKKAPAKKAPAKNASDPKPNPFASLFGGSSSKTPTKKIARQQKAVPRSPTKKIQRKVAPKPTAKKAAPKVAPKSTRIVQRAQTGGVQKGGKSAVKGGAPRSGTAIIGVKKSTRDMRTVFVAGSTGKVGMRTVRYLIEAGYSVRAGTRDVQKGNDTVASLSETYGLDKVLARKVTVVPYDCTSAESTIEAVGKAGVVVSAMRASSGGKAKEVEGDGTISLINISAALGVKQFILATTLEKPSFPASLFGGGATQTRRAEKALEEQTAMAYLIIRPGSMGNVTDTYEETTNMTFGARNKVKSGKVSSLQVAQVCAGAVGSGDVAENKVVEVVASEKAPKKSVRELLEGVEGISQAEREAAAAKMEKMKKQIADLEASMSQSIEERAEVQASLSEASKALKQKIDEATKAQAALEQAYAQVDKLEASVDSLALETDMAKAVCSAAQSALRSGTPLTPQEINDVQNAVRDKAASKAAKKTPASAKARKAAPVARAAPGVKAAPRVAAVAAPKAPEKDDQFAARRAAIAEAVAKKEAEAEKARAAALAEFNKQIEAGEKAQEAENKKRLKDRMEQEKALQAAAQSIQAIAVPEAAKKAAPAAKKAAPAAKKAAPAAKKAAPAAKKAAPAAKKAPAPAAKKAAPKVAVKAAATAIPQMTATDQVAAWKKRAKASGKKPAAKAKPAPKKPAPAKKAPPAKKATPVKAKKPAEKKEKSLKAPAGVDEEEAVQMIASEIVAAWKQRSMDEDDLGSNGAGGNGAQASAPVGDVTDKEAAKKLVSAWKKRAGKTKKGFSFPWSK